MRSTRALVLLLVGCGSGETPADGGADAGRPVDAGADAGRVDAGRSDAGACGELSEPSAVLRPRAGELFYLQMGLSGLSLGEAALVVGPDGTRVLIDVANDSHDDDIAREVSAWAGATSVDHVVITHFHADHGDGIEDLLGRIDVTGRFVHRGFTDLTPVANEATVARLCAAIAARPGSGAPLCTAAEAIACDPASWSGTYPAIACAGLDTEDLALGGGAMIDFVGANGFIGGESYASVVGPILVDDSNGENARSVVALLRHGAFRMLVAGDLTGGGSDTDAVEGFYASRFGAAISELGVDVLHAGHHGRNTSSGPEWLDRLLPDDGRARNAIMGVSAGHVGSPHDEVLAALIGSGRLGLGTAWTTRVATGGASVAGLVDAGGGSLVVTTLNGGAAYAVQAIAEDGTLIESRAYHSLGACP